MESFAFPNKCNQNTLEAYYEILLTHLFSGNWHIVKLCHSQMAAKSFCFPLLLLPKGIGLMWN